MAEKLTTAQVAQLKRLAIGPDYGFKMQTAKALIALGYAEGSGWSSRDWFSCIYITEAGRHALAAGEEKTDG